MMCCLCDKSSWIRLQFQTKIKQERRMEYILGLILEMLGKEDMSFLSKTVQLPVKPLTDWPPDVVA